MGVLEEEREQEIENLFLKNDRTLPLPGERKMLQNRPGGWMQMIYYCQMDPPLCSGGPPPCTRFTLPTARERRLSMPETGEKEKDYLFKKLYRLRVITQCLH